MNSEGFREQVAENQLGSILKARSKLATSARDSLGNSFTWEGGGPATVEMRLSVNPTTKTAFSGAVDDTFWGPYS